MPRIPIAAKPQIFYIRPAPGWLEECFLETQGLLNKPLQKYKFEAKAECLRSIIKVSHCDWRQGLELVFRLTTAHDIEWLIAERPCANWAELERFLSSIDWSELLPEIEMKAHVTIEVHEGFSKGSAKLRAKFCEFAKVQHASEGALFRFKLELRENRARVLVSLAGEPLYKRGYKEHLFATAPLPEHTANACIRWVLKDKNIQQVSAVWVPFAGSGTFGFEALLFLAGGGSGTFRGNFSCEAFPATPKATLQFFRKKMQQAWNTQTPPAIVFNEINEQALSSLKKNSEPFSRKASFLFQQGDFFNFIPPAPKEGALLILLNPPFGNRLAKKSSVEDLYRKIGSYLREKLKQVEGEVIGGCICPDEITWREFLKALKPQKSETHHFTHGGKQMRLIKW